MLFLNKFRTSHKELDILNSECGVKVARKSNQSIYLEVLRFVTDRLDSFIDKVCIFQVQERAANQRKVAYRSEGQAEPTPGALLISAEALNTKS